MSLPNQFPQFDTANYLRLSRNLAGAPDQASQRSAIDRAYYSAFLIAREQLRLKRYITSLRGNEHEIVTQVLLRISRPFGEQVRELRRARSEVTYNLDDVELRAGQSVRWAIDTARVVITAVRALPENA